MLLPSTRSRMLTLKQVMDGSKNLRQGTEYVCLLLTVTGEKLSSDTAAVAPFIEKFKKKVDELNLRPEQVYNADKSGLF